MAKGMKPRESEMRPVVEVEEVERPLGTKTAWDVGPEVNQIIETVQNMKAVKMRFRNPKEIARIQMAIRHAVEKVDLVAVVMFFTCAAAERSVAQQSRFNHLRISGPLRSYRSLLPPHPAEWTVVMVVRADCTRSFPSRSLNAYRMMRLLMQGRLCTQDRHKANGVSDVRTARKCACLCGMRCGEQLLTFDHRLLAGNVE